MIGSVDLVVFCLSLSDNVSSLGERRLFLFVQCLDEIATFFLSEMFFDLQRMRLLSSAVITR
jgi:hypothetical protein